MSAVLVVIIGSVYHKAHNLYHKFYKKTVSNTDVVLLTIFWIYILSHQIHFLKSLNEKLPYSN